jgi:hypothetical protein
MLHDQFKDEAEFRAKFVRPLLTQLGYVGIAALHGSQEFGKDFVFAELTPFGFLKYHAAVVKHETSINQGTRILEDVLRQIREVFAINFRISDSPTEHCVSSVYVFNSGNITENAKTYFRRELDKRDYGANVHIFDGERLHQLDLTTTAQEQQRYLPRLLGLELQLRMNMRVWESMLGDLPRFTEPRGCFTTAIDNYLTEPFLTEVIDTGELSLLLQECRIIDTINFKYLTSTIQAKAPRTTDIETVKRVIAQAMVRSEKLIEQLKLIIQNFFSLSTTSITAVVRSDDTVK